MKTKLLATLAIVSACQPTSIYPMTQGPEVIETYSFGLSPSPQSSLTVFGRDNGCEDIVFDNQLSKVPDVIVKKINGHHVMLQMNFDTEPDEMFVSPDVGYYVVGDDTILVDEGQIGTITVCMEAMS